MVIITPCRDMASCSRVIAANVPDLPSSPHHPSETFSFPKRSFGKTKVVWRSFQPAWYRQWPFLHYDESNDLAYCHTCVQAEEDENIECRSSFCKLISWPDHSNIACSVPENMPVHETRYFSWVPSSQIVSHPPEK